MIGIRLASHRYDPCVCLLCRMAGDILGVSVAPVKDGPTLTLPPLGSRWGPVTPGVVRPFRTPRSITTIKMNISK